MIRYSATSSFPYDTARKSAVLGDAVDLGDRGAEIVTELDEVDVRARGGAGGGCGTVRKHEVW